MDTKPIENSEASGQPYLQMNNNSKLMPPICRHKILSRLGNTFVMGSGIQPGRRTLWNHSASVRLTPPGDVVMQAIHQSTSTNKNTNGEVNGTSTGVGPKAHNLMALSFSREFGQGRALESPRRHSTCDQAEPKDQARAKFRVAAHSRVPCFNAGHLFPQH